MKSFVRWVFDSSRDANSVVAFVAIVWATLLAVGTVVLFAYLLNSGHFLLAGAFAMAAPAAFLLAIYLFDQFRK